MKKINLKNIDMTLYTETLSNGLEVYMLPYKNKKNYYVTFATRYGSDVLEFTDVSKKSYKPPLGIAHFLEHKMFEEESGEDPFSFYAKSGTDCNACTSFESTQYMFWGTKNFNKNLEYLLRFVTHPYFTDQNVKKEKGIIAEEIKMYRDYPDYRLELKLRENLYKNHPRKLDIAGTVSEINKITKEDLYNCYNGFYIPSNMFILMTGNFDPDIALEIIRNELDSNKKTKIPKIKKIVEPIKVCKDMDVIKGNVEIPKVAIGLKLSTKDMELDELELSLYLNMLTTIIFGDSSLFKERVREKKILNGLSTGWENLEDISTFYIQAASIKPDELINEIISEFNNVKIDEESFNRIKKVWISREIKMVDNIEEEADNIYYDVLKYKKIIPNKIDIIKNMKFKVLKDIVKNVNFKNYSIVKMEKE
ncbi:MAG: insulinase family protein [Bacilli bacterium]|nr:insulinase family protein [Bacilli bacterium]